jgi:hypothetical protein
MQRCRPASAGEGTAGSSVEILAWRAVTTTDASGTGVRLYFWSGLDFFLHIRGPGFQWVVVLMLMNDGQRMPNYAPIPIRVRCLGTAG